jgi:hypothetical protein
MYNSFIHSFIHASRYLRKYKSSLGPTGLIPKPRGGCKKYTLNSDDLSLLKNNCDSTLAQLQNELFLSTGKKVSLSTIFNYINRHDDAAGVAVVNSPTITPTAGI